MGSTVLGVERRLGSVFIAGCKKTKAPWEMRWPTEAERGALRDEAAWSGSDQLHQSAGECRRQNMKARAKSRGLPPLAPHYVLCSRLKYTTITITKENVLGAAS